MPAIYRIDLIENLRAFAAEGAIRCRCEQPVGAASLGNTSIIGQRSAVPVPTGPGGTLHDYVPFYFAPRSPMLYAIQNGNGVERRSPQEIAYLVSSTERLAEAGIPLVFTDGHALMALSEFHTDPAALDRVIDWDLMTDRYWADTQADPDRKRRRQAECLVHRQFPLRFVEQVVAYNRAAVPDIQEALRGCLEVPIDVRRTWYY